jgi:predicted dehydrogenase
MTGNGPLRIAAVGTRGHAARVVVPTVQSSRRVELVGLLGSDPSRTEAAADRLNVRAFRSVAELLESDAIDAVWITAPNNLHAALAEEFLSGGVHVLLEKPMAIEELAAAHLVATAEKSGVVLRVAYQHRYREAHRRLREAIAEEHFGDLGYLRIHRHWRFPYFPGQDVSELSDWRGAASSSGGWAINDIGSHLVDVLIWLAGSLPLTMLSAIFARQYPEIDNDSSSHLTVRMGAHCVAQVDTSNQLESPGSLIEVYGDKGWMRLGDSFADTATMESHLGFETIRNVSSAETYQLMLDDFVGACRGGPSIGTDPSEALLGVRLTQQARRVGHFVEDF